MVPNMTRLGERLGRRVCAVLAILSVVLCSSTSSLAEDTLEEQLAAIRAEIEAILARLEALRALVDMIDPPSLAPSFGLNMSPANPVHAKVAVDTLATLLPDTTNLLAPLTSTLRRTFPGDHSGSARVDDFYINAISSSSADGFDISYVVGGEERSVQFGSDDFNTEDCRGCYYTQNEDGEGGHWFWSFTDSFRGSETNTGSSEFKYFDANGGTFTGGHRFIATYGARTEPGGLPAGSASYFGRMFAEAYKKDDPARDQRVKMSGRIELTANLDEGTLDGAVHEIRTRGPGEGAYSDLPDSAAHFAITDGKIVDGQFTATLTGMGNAQIFDFGYVDEEGTVNYSDADSTVLGYEGGVLGEFYGPAGEEVNGVLSASSDMHNRVLAGFFGGTIGGPYGHVEISESAVRGVSGAKLIDYLKDQASGGPWGPAGNQWSREPGFGLWRTQPTVRFETDATPRQRQLVEQAVDLLNDWLPVRNRMLMGEPTSRRPQGSERRGDAPPIREVPDGDIHVSFRFAHGDGGVQHPYESVSRDPQSGRGVYNIVASLIEVEPAGTGGSHPQFGIIVHEMIHALGLEGHVFEGDHPETLMPDTGPLPDELQLHDIPRIDGEALMTAYSLYDTGQTDDDINYTTLGPWASTVPAISGRIRTDGDAVEFGVEYRSQWIRAWDEGPIPTTFLADSPLTGTVVWEGQMVGYTDQGQEATGAAGFAVEIDTLTGTAGFTEIMANGSPWAGGHDLSTTISVLGNHIESTKGGPWVGFDGQFRGSGHEAVTGAFRWERNDTGNLTAAFGATRELESQDLMVASK